MSKPLPKDPSAIPSQASPIYADIAYDMPKIFAERIKQNAGPVLEPAQKRYSYYMRDDAIDYVASLPKDISINELALAVLHVDQTYLFPIFRATVALNSV